MDNPPNDGPCEVTITAADRDWLQQFVRELVTERLAAAAHLDTMHTIYRWDGVQEAEEGRARLHTNATRVCEISERVRASHPYDVPCVVATPITFGDPDYLSWIESNVSTGCENPQQRH